MTNFTPSNLLISFFLLTGSVVLFLMVNQLQKYKHHFSSSIGSRLFLLTQLVPGIAGCFYLLMSMLWLFGFSEISSVNNLRHFDWLLTTPIIMYVVGYIANRGFRHWTQLAIIILDVYMILSGMVEGFVSSKIALIFFVSGNVDFMAMIAILLYWNQQLKKVKDSPSTELYRRLMKITLIGWLMYPIIAALSHQSIGFFDIETQIGLYMVLDIFSKGFFAFLIASDTLTAEELAFTAK